MSETGEPKRLKILVSAYACEPGKGSEPEVGWQWVQRMARFHDVTVVTRSNNRALIEAHVGAPRVRFIYHDLSPLLLNLKRRLPITSLYYEFWQRSARKLIARLIRDEQFDLLHHLTFAGFRFGTAVLGHGVPAIWGPVGGIEAVPSNLLPTRYPAVFAQELARNMAGALASLTIGSLTAKARAASLVIASTKEMQEALGRCGVDARLLPTIGITPPPLTDQPRSEAGLLKLVFVGRIVWWKGVEFALRALAASNSEATLTFIGTGPFAGHAQRLAAELGIGGRVAFWGAKAREEVLELYRDFDAVLCPSLHDSGAFTLLEAMAREVPVICLAAGGPALSVKEGCGFAVPLGTKHEIVGALARAIETYDRNRSLLAEHGVNARRHVIAEYDWNRKGEVMNAIYQEICSS